MDKERKLIIAGNWKMNKTVAEALDLVTNLKRFWGGESHLILKKNPPPKKTKKNRFFWPKNLFFKKKKLKQKNVLYL
jgi:hypothetical protein